MQRPTDDAKPLRTFITALYLLALFLSAGAPQAHARDAQSRNETPALDLHSYEAELQRDSRLIERIKNQPAEISSFRSSLPSVWVVRANGTEFRVSTDSLDSALADLQTRPKNAGTIARDIEFRLETMRQSAIELEKRTDDVSESAARADLNKVFRQKEFEGLKGPGAWQLLEERIGLWIARQIDRLLRRLHISAKTGNFLAWSVIALALLAIGYWAFRTLSRDARMTEMPAFAPAAPSDARAWVRDALAAAEKGEYREAVHCAYWAAIARLEDLKLLARDRSRTPRESLRLLDSYPNQQTVLRDLTGHFELIWYGDRPASPADWSGAKTHLEKFGCLTASTAPTANS
ncbi:MAG TPA: DUF4129 domain-containing protein [Candidatus Acidoferrales bacterium]|nr:DUF4129 domain-containing protein [Candidatus Acidoferrales bacterium]